MKLLLIAAALFLAGCKDETPPHWEDVCTEQVFSHFITTFISTGKTMMPINTPVYRCAKTERKCVVGKDFMGVKECRG